LMRLLVVSQYFWPENFRVNEIVSEMVARGHEVTVLTGRPNYPEGVLNEEFVSHPQRFNEFRGARVHRVNLRPRGRGSLNLVLNYWSFVVRGCLQGPWLLRGQAFDHIFVFQTSPITAALPALLLRRLKRVTLSMWVLDIWPDTLAAIGVVRSPRALGLIGQLCRFIYRRCDLLLGQSPAFAEPLARWSGDPAKFRHFPNWVEAGVEPASEVRPAPELLPYVGRFRVLFAGNFGEAQDLPTVLEAAALARAQRPDICWLLVGSGRTQEHLKQKIELLQLQETVFLLGRYPLERMPDFFAGADALLVSLKKEPIFSMTVPGKLQSYLVTGKPIVAMLDGEGRRVIEAAKCGVCGQAGDAAALAANVIWLSTLGDSELRMFGENGRRLANEQFNRADLMARLESWMGNEAARLPT
jgi:colanic acid biosynthesis glycosyl transferase WcaI